MSDAQETVQVKGTKGVVMGLLALMAGGGIGATAVGSASGRDATELPTPYLSRVEVEGVAGERANRAEERAIAHSKAFAAAEVVAAKEACDKRLTDSLGKLDRKLDKLDQIAEDVALLKGAIRAKGR